MLLAFFFNADAPDKYTRVLVPGQDLVVLSNIIKTESTSAQRYKPFVSVNYGFL